MEEVINDRRIRIVEYSTEKNWFGQLPSEDWLCILVVNDKPRRYIDEVISKIIAKDVRYVCTIGKQCELAHDLLDEEITFREVEIEKLYLPNHDIMTTWHHDFEEGIWFATFAAHDEEIRIKEIIILDMTDGAETQRVKECLKKIKTEESDKE